MKEVGGREGSFGDGTGQQGVLGKCWQDQCLQEQMRFQAYTHHPRLSIPICFHYVAGAPA